MPCTRRWRVVPPRLISSTSCHTTQARPTSRSTSAPTMPSIYFTPGASPVAAASRSMSTNEAVTAWSRRCETGDCCSRCCSKRSRTEALTLPPRRRLAPELTGSTAAGQATRIVSATSSSAAVALARCRGDACVARAPPPRPDRPQTRAHQLTSSAPRKTCHSEPARNLVVTRAHSYRPENPRSSHLRETPSPLQSSSEHPESLVRDHCQMHCSPCQVPEQHQWECNPTEKAQAAMSA